MDEKKQEKFKITVEPILFGIVFAMAQAEGLITNLFLRQACYYEGYSLENCTGESQNSAQKQISYIETFKLLIENVFPTVLSFFSGPWSNENGRKFILTSSITGYGLISLRLGNFVYDHDALGDGCFLDLLDQNPFSWSYGLFFFSWGILSLIKDLHPAYFLFCSLPIAFSGGMVGLLLSCFCYVADITQPQFRALRLGIAELTINLAMLTGYLLCPYVYKIIPNSFWLPFLINTVISFLCLIYSIYFLPESIQILPDRNKNLFRFDHLKMTFKTMIKKRESYERAVIFICISISFLNLITIFGEGPVKYMSLMREFDWSLSNYTTYNVVLLTLLGLISTFALVVLHKMLKMPDNLLLLVTFVTKAAAGFLMALAMSSSFFYFASILGSLRGVVGPISKSIVSHIIKPEEVGVLFSFFSSIECLTPIVAAPLYNTIYAALVTNAPLAIYFVSFSLYTFGAFLILLNVYFMRSINAHKNLTVAASEEIPREKS